MATLALCGATPNWQIDANQQPFTVRVGPRVDFAWGASSAMPNVPSGNLLVRWKGYVKVPTSGAWRFGARSDDGVRIWVNKATPDATNRDVDIWTDQSALPTATQWSANAVTGLTAGTWYPIQVDYYAKKPAGQANELGGITVYAKPDGQSGDGTPLDASQLSSDPETLPHGWPGQRRSRRLARLLRAVVSTSQVVAYDTSGQPHTYTWTGSFYDDALRRLRPSRQLLDGGYCNGGSGRAAPLDPVAQRVRDDPQIPGDHRDRLPRLTHDPNRALAELRIEPSSYLRHGISS